MSMNCKRAYVTYIGFEAFQKIGAKVINCTGRMHMRKIQRPQNKTRRRSIALKKALAHRDAYTPLS